MDALLLNYSRIKETRKEYPWRRSWSRLLTAGGFLQKFPGEHGAKSKKDEPIAHSSGDQLVV